ncbi:hypothetical protein HELRODRAFT_192380 [Helobdella robusta]|uniref:Sulfhydryl oxidase n=1 Tax=Helobdella robusta TaxID=6412 RepID=T1FTV9_HELRO|nr:hypothetical protein HELRODRAFT_192380 [Helobdella robusta]ESO01113.1 hypothetical protein HELRODRAFT_192380 [Helobdella robusta]
MLRMRSGCFLVVFLLLSALNLITESAVDYSNDKWITALNRDSFAKLVNGSDAFWVVEYYLPWCGACNSFAPIFSAWAWETRRWSPIVKVGAISCDSESDMCVSENIHGVPLVKFYYSWDNAKRSKDLSTGIPDVGQMRRALLNELQKIINSTTTKQAKWPTLAEINLNGSLFNDDQFVFVIVENEHAHANDIGRSVIMDNIMLMPDVMVYRCNDKSPDNNLVAGFYRYFSFNNSYANINAEYSRAGINAVILAVTGKNINGGGEEGGDKNDDVIPDVRVDDKSYVYKPPLGLYVQDLTTSIYHLFHYEVASQTTIDKEAYKALKTYLMVLYRFHIVDAPVLEFVRSILGWLNTVSPPITSQQWEEAIKSVDTRTAYLPEKNEWKACKGSVSHYRGYPCSLWVTIHTLLVSAHRNPRGENVQRVGMDILLAFRGYIEHFFRCIECRENFVKYSKNWLTEPKNASWTAKKASIDIWRRHNLVNLNLHKISPLTEDPEFPKIQFPSIVDCPRCRRVTSRNFSVFVSNISDWDQEKVFDYLVKFYSIPKSQNCAERGKPIVSTAWGPCSKTCDAGVSTRFSNDNDECKLEIQTQICMDRPCSINFPSWTESLKKRQECITRGNTYTSSVSSTLNFSSCSTLLKEKWNICGLCPSRRPGGRPVCCVPKIFTQKSFKVLCSNLTIANERKDSKEDAVWLNEKLKPKDIERARYSVGEINVRMVKLCACDEKYC